MKKALLSASFFLILCSFSATVFAQSEVWYIRKAGGEPWGGGWAPIPNTNISEMDQIFNCPPEFTWNSDFYSTVDVAAAFGPTSSFVFMEGGDNHAIAMKNFITANMTEIEDWVFNGGNLYIEAAPNEGGDILLGFGGVTINYPSYSWTATVVEPTHPIFLGPYTPTGLAFSGTYYGHATVFGGATVPLIEDDASGEAVVAEVSWGAGKVIFAGTTVTCWSDPDPEVVNVRYNIFIYLSSGAAAGALGFGYGPAADDTVFCQYEPDPTAVLLPGAVAGLYHAYPAGIVVDEATGTIDLGASTPGTYTVYNVGGVGCLSDSAEVTVYIEAPPVANAGPDVEVCVGNSVMLDGSGGATYSWTPPVYLDDPTLEDPTVVAPATTMYYQMIAYSTLGCSDTDNVVATLNPLPIIDAGQDQIMVLGGFTQLDASGAATYTWTPVETLSDPDISNPTAFPEDTTMYVVTGTDLNGCVGMDSVMIYVIEESDIATPNAFTPNGDGLNDVFKPSFVGLGEITDFYVYNRWGKLLYFSVDPTKGWDGSLNGIEQEVGTYLVVIKGVNQFGDEIMKTGTIALLR